jgi:hypothetical protein
MEQFKCVLVVAVCSVSAEGAVVVVMLTRVELSGDHQWVEESLHLCGGSEAGAQGFGGPSRSVRPSGHMVIQHHTIGVWSGELAAVGYDGAQHTHACDPTERQLSIRRERLHRS